ncbi:ester cyclase [Protaetiibacter sp. WY-16]|uniref:Ester cyclase n=2 Tax=Antiquaquibacter soli TaxID=3064523 RepID=A0ABT9BQC0_9MICO|nr:ester cyclase [Protaetiibacter sp. WY-16]
MREWFAEYLEALNRHDLAALRELIEPGVRRAHRPGGVEAWVSELDELYRGFPDWKVRRIQLVIEDDRIAAHLRGSGTHAGSYRGIAATGRHVNTAEFVFCRLGNGRITEVTGSDDAELLRQITA